MKSLVFFLILCVCGGFGLTSNLLSVVVVFRHGDRTPSSFFPTDPHKDSTYWSTEPGELTYKGKNQQFGFGTWLRNRYSDFLPDAYHKSDIYIRSSDTDRCLMSAAVNLAGLYPPKGDQVWNSSLLWMPIPIHTVPLKEDRLLRMGRACPKFQPKYQKLLNNENFTAIDKENAELYAFLTKHLGQEIKTFSDIEEPYDTMFIEAQHNLGVPDWSNEVLRDNRKVFPDEMKIWADLSYETPTYTTELARLGTGRFFDTLASHLEAVASNDTSHKLADKIVLFSAHKSTLGDLTHTLSVFKLAPYAAGLIFELRKNPSTNNIYVNTLFSTPTKLEHLQVAGCEIDCDFDKFLDILKPYRLSEKQWESECLSRGSTMVASIYFLSVLLTFSWYHLF